MKDTFEKSTNTGVIAAIAVGVVLVAGLGYLFLTKDGEKMLEEVSGKLKQRIKDAASDVISKKTGFSKKTVKTVANHVIK